MPDITGKHAQNKHEGQSAVSQKEKRGHRDRIIMVDGATNDQILKSRYQTIITATMHVLNMHKLKNEGMQENIQLYSD